MRLKSSRLYIIITILFITLLIVIPTVVNHLMSFKVIKVYGDTNTWIAFLGSYIGSIISGLITFLGVLLTLEFTKKESRRDKLPEKINNIEECLDYIEERLAELEMLTRIDMEEILSISTHERNLKLFDIDGNFILKNKTVTNNLTKEHVKIIRNYTVQIDTKAYEYFLNFNKTLAKAYLKFIIPIDDKLSSFQTNVIDTYKDTDIMIIIGNENTLDEIELNADDKTALNEIKSELYRTEPDYINDMQNAYMYLRRKLRFLLLDLTKEFSA